MASGRVFNGGAVGNSTNDSSIQLPGDVAHREANHFSVTDNFTAGRDIRRGDFMPLWDVLDERQAVRETRSGGQSPIVDNNRHIICWVNFI